MKCQGCKKLSSAAVVIGALRVKLKPSNCINGHVQIGGQKSLQKLRNERVKRRWYCFRGIVKAEYLIIILIVSVSPYNIYYGYSVEVPQ